MRVDDKIAYPGILLVFAAIASFVMAGCCEEPELSSSPKSVQLIETLSGSEYYKPPYSQSELTLVGTRCVPLGSRLNIKFQDPYVNNETCEVEGTNRVYLDADGQLEASFGSIKPSCLPLTGEGYYHCFLSSRIMVSIAANGQLPTGDHTREVELRLYSLYSYETVFETAEGFDAEFFPEGFFDKGEEGSLPPVIAVYTVATDNPEAPEIPEGTTPDADGYYRCALVMHGYYSLMLGP